MGNEEVANVEKLVANRTCIFGNSGEKDWVDRGQGKRVKVKGVIGVCVGWCALNFLLGQYRDIICTVWQCYCVLHSVSYVYSMAALFTYIAHFTKRALTVCIQLMCIYLIVRAPHIHNYTNESFTDTILYTPYI